MKFSKYIDHTLLKPEATTEQIDALIDEAIRYDFASVCVAPCYVAHAHEKLNGTSVRVCTVIGFPLGTQTTAMKVAETCEAIANGADEIDMVIHVGTLKEGRDEDVRNEIAQVVKAADGHLVKVILETCLLEKEEIVRACRQAMAASADFVKTSTDFSYGGACEEDVLLMKESVTDAMGVKASGGIRTLKDALAMIKAGATRLGTSSGVAIMEDYLKNDNPVT